MLTARRASRPRHEFRFGPREIAVLGAVVLVIWGLTFALGVLVGREMAPTGSRAKAPAGAVAAAPDRAGPPAKPENGAEERLTFYQTLTAPTADLPAIGRPAVEERLVPHEAPVAKPKAEARPEPRAPAPVPAPERPAAPRVVPGTVRTPPPPGPAAAAPAEPQLWTVQVSSFRNRALAEELRTRLGARGFDAYVVSISAEEGRVRHRVRVGTFPTRGEAERLAQDLRNERNFNPFVTARTR
jgi:DedD protein